MESISNLEIKELTPDDWKIYRGIRLEALKVEPKAFLSTYEETLKRKEEDWRSKLENKSNSFTVVALKDGKAVGMIGAYQIDSENDPAIEIFGVYVSPTFRGTGVANMLMEKVIFKAKEIQGIKKIKLECEQNQIAARKFYEKNGFKKYAVDSSGHRDLLELLV